MQIKENIGEKLNSIVDTLLSKKPFLTIEEASVITGYKTSYLRVHFSKKITSYRPSGKVIYFKTSDILALDISANEELLELRKFKSNTLINNEFNTLDSITKEKIIMIIYDLYGKLNKNSDKQQEDSEEEDLCDFCGVLPKSKLSNYCNACKHENLS